MKETWSVVVIHGEEGAKAQADNFCGQLTKRFWDRFDFKVCSWAFGDLKTQEEAAAAARAAVKADFIVICGCAEAGLPEHLRWWIESWVGERGDREGILVGLLTSPGGAETELVETHARLRDSAHRSGMDYLTELPQSFSWPIPESIEAYSERAGTTTAVLDEILHHQAMPSALTAEERGPRVYPR
jgi:hypothetical protein